MTTAETVDAGLAAVHVRKDGSPERVEGSGRVTISRAEGGVLTAERGDGTIDAAGKPSGARFGGGVRFTEEDAARKMEGQASNLAVRFDQAGQAQHATMTGGVTMAEREMGTVTKAASRRTLVGNAVEVDLGPAARRVGRIQRTEIRDADAAGGARLVVASDAPLDRKGGPTTTDLAGDDMKAHFATGQRISNLVAVGHTVLHQVDAAGTEERSVGERTELAFRTAADAPGSGVADIQSAVQEGYVEMVRKSVKVQGGVSTTAEQRATGERAVFEGASNRVTLTGNVVLSDAMSTLWAAKVAVDRASGDAAAEGGVRVSYVQAAEAGKEAEPMHVLADHAVLRRGSGSGGAGRGGADTALFYGSAGRRRGCGRVGRRWRLRCWSSIRARAG